MGRLVRDGLAGIAIAVLAGCGTFSFEAKPGGGDAGPPDAAPPRDAGTPDSGPMIDGGCLPHVLASNIPTSEDTDPWEDTREALEGLFLERADVQNCLTCHARDNTGAMVVLGPLSTEDPLPAAMVPEYEETRENLWRLIRESQPATLDDTNPAGPFWFHHPNYDTTEDNEPVYTENQRMFVEFLNSLFDKLAACKNERYLAMPGDAGPNCGEPMTGDAGAGPDAGELDGGGMDGGVGMDGGGPDAGAPDSGRTGPITGLCYCENIPDAGLRPDLTLYCK